MHLEGFDLGAEEQSVSLPSPVEWLNAQMITHHVHLASPQVDDDDREHAIEALEHTGQSEVLVEAKDHFGIGAAAELVTSGFQLGLVTEGVVDLAIECKNDTLVIIAHRLMAPFGEVENAQTIEAECAFKDVGIERVAPTKFDRLAALKGKQPHTLIIWAAVALTINHPSQHQRIDGRALKLKKPMNPHI